MGKSNEKNLKGIIQIKRKNNKDTVLINRIQFHSVRKWLRLYSELQKFCYAEIGKKNQSSATQTYNMLIKLL